MKRDYNVIGRPRRRVDGRAKVLGQTRFADDLSFPRMLHCKLLRSRYPHARLRSVKVDRALRGPGVQAVLTGADFPISRAPLYSTRQSLRTATGSRLPTSCPEPRTLWNST